MHDSHSLFGAVTTSISPDNSYIVCFLWSCICIRQGLDGVCWKSVDDTGSSENPVL